MTDTDAVMDNDLIQARQFVIIEMPSGNSKIVNLKPNTMISLGKFGNFHSDNLIGKPYGLSYEILGKQGEIRPVGHVSKNTNVEETDANNQTIVDDNAVQKLSHEEVLKLKEMGLRGELDTEEIIKKMVDSHAEFSKKTEYSKAKYIERKKKKFMKVFTPVRPTLSTVTDYFFTKNSEKIKHLRIDTLSILLSMANVHANSKLLVVDDTQGLIVASCLERMGGFGQVVALHEGDFHSYDILRYMNFPKSIQDTLYTVPFAMIDPTTPEEPFDALSEEEYEKLDDNHQRSYLRRKSTWDYKVKSRKLLFEGDFDGLIISSAFQPESVLKVLKDYVSGSRPVVVYSFSKEVLLQAAFWMRRTRDFLNADVTESSLREYQVLPGRMHPNMNMSAGGGYLLSALRVIDCPYDPSLAQRGSNNNDRRSKKKKKNNNNKKEVTPKETVESKEEDVKMEEATPAPAPEASS